MLGFTDGSSYEVKEGLNEGDIILIGSAINSTGTVNRANNSGRNNEGMPEGMQGGNVPSGNMPNFEGGMPNGAPGNS